MASGNSSYIATSPGLSDPSVSDLGFRTKHHSDGENQIEDQLTVLSTCGILSEVLESLGLKAAS